MSDEARFAAIGRAVVEYCMGKDNVLAARQATPEGVVAFLKRRDDERHSMETSTALRVGRLMCNAAAILKQEIG